MYELLPEYVQNWLMKNAWKYPNVIGFSNAMMPRMRNHSATRKPVLRFYVRAKKGLGELRYPKDVIPAWVGIRNRIRKQEFDTDVVQIGDVRGPQPIPPLSLSEDNKKLMKLAVDKTVNFRPVELGVSVGNEMITAGSLGMLYLLATNPAFKIYDKVVAGSNAHVLTPDPTWSIDEIIESRKVRILQRGAYHGGKVPEDVVGSYLWHQQINVLGGSSCPIGNGVAWTLNKLASALRRRTRFRTYVEGINTIDFALYELSVDHKLKIADDSINVRNPFVGHLYAGSTDVGVLCKISEILKARPDIKPHSDNWLDPQVGDEVAGCSFWCNTKQTVTDVNAILNVGGYGGLSGTALFQKSVLITNVGSVIKGGWSGSGWFKA